MLPFVSLSTLTHNYPLISTKQGHSPVDKPPQPTSNAVGGVPRKLYLKRSSKFPVMPQAVAQFRNNSTNAFYIQTIAQRLDGLQPFMDSMGMKPTRGKTYILSSVCMPGRLAPLTLLHDVRSLASGPQNHRHAERRHPFAQTVFAGGQIVEPAMPTVAL